MDSASAVIVPRFIRVNPRVHERPTREQIEAQLNTKLSITQLPDMYALDAQVQIASSEYYKNGSIYGLDLASALSVHALQPQPHDHCLDLCAPGNKLAMIADRMSEVWMKMKVKEGEAASSSSSLSSDPSTSDRPSGSVTGVDWNYQRLAGARTLTHKYQLTGTHKQQQMRLSPLMRLILADGQGFDEPPPNLNDGAQVKLMMQGQIIDMTGVTTGSASNPTTIASSAAYHCASASNSSCLAMAAVVSSSSSPSSSSTPTTAPVVLRMNKRTKRALKENVAREEWKKKQRLNEGEGSTDSSESNVDEEEKKEDDADATMEADIPVSLSHQQQPRLYDRVLVDAECTQDSSVKQMAKLDKQMKDVIDGVDNPSTASSSPSASSSLQTLQRNRLLNGFANLRVGGTLIYSTCSHDSAQNEQIVDWLLRRHPHDARAISVWSDVDGISERSEVKVAMSSSSYYRIEQIRLAPERPLLRYECGALLSSSASGLVSSPSSSSTIVASSASEPHFGIRLSPRVSGTSGHYIAKIIKLESHQQQPTSSTSSTELRSSADRCDADSMSLIFSFLDSVTFSFALLVNRHWNRAAGLRSSWPSFMLSDRVQVVNCCHEMLLSSSPSNKFRSVCIIPALVPQLVSSPVYSHTPVIHLDFTEFRTHEWLDANALARLSRLSLLPYLRRLAILDHGHSSGMMLSRLAPQVSNRLRSLILQGHSSSPHEFPNLRLDLFTFLEQLSIDFVPPLDQLMKLTQLSHLHLMECLTHPLGCAVRYLSVSHRLKCCSIDLGWMCDTCSLFQDFDLPPPSPVIGEDGECHLVYDPHALIRPLISSCHSPALFTHLRITRSGGLNARQISHLSQLPSVQHLTCTISSEEVKVENDDRDDGMHQPLADSLPTRLRHQIVPFLSILSDDDLRDIHDFFSRLTSLDLCVLVPDSLFKSMTEVDAMNEKRSHAVEALNSLTTMVLACVSLEVLHIRIPDLIETFESRQWKIDLSALSHLRDLTINGKQQRLEEFTNEPLHALMDASQLIHNSDCVSLVMSYLDSVTFISALCVSLNWNRAAGLRTSWPRFEIRDRLKDVKNDSVDSRCISIKPSAVSNVRMSRIYSQTHSLRIDFTRWDSTRPGVIEEVARMSQLTNLQSLILTETSTKRCEKLLYLLADSPIPVHLVSLVYRNRIDSRRSPDFSWLSQFSHLRSLLIDFLPHSALPHLIQLRQLEHLGMCDDSVNMTALTPHLVGCIRYLSVRYQLRSFSDPTWRTPSSAFADAIRAFGEMKWSAFDWTTLPELQQYFKGEIGQGEVIGPARLTQLRLSHESAMNHDELTSLCYLTDVTHLYCQLEPRIAGNEPTVETTLPPHQREFLARLEDLTLCVSQVNRLNVHALDDNANALDQITYIMRECIGLQHAQIWISQGTYGETSGKCDSSAWLPHLAHLTQLRTLRINNDAQDIKSIQVSTASKWFSPADRCDADSASLIFSYLDSISFSFALQVNRHWNRAAELRSSWPSNSLSLVDRTDVVNNKSDQKGLNVSRCVRIRPSTLSQLISSRIYSHTHEVHLDLTDWNSTPIDEINLAAQLSRLSQVHHLSSFDPCQTTRRHTILTSLTPTFSERLISFVLLGGISLASGYLSSLRSLRSLMIDSLGNILPLLDLHQLVELELGDKSLIFCDLLCLVRYMSVRYQLRSFSCWIRHDTTHTLVALAQTSWASNNWNVRQYGIGKSFAELTEDVPPALLTRLTLNQEYFGLNRGEFSSLCYLPQLRSLKCKIWPHENDKMDELFTVHQQFLSRLTHLTIALSLRQYESRWTPEDTHSIDTIKAILAEAHDLQFGHISICRGYDAELYSVDATDLLFSLAAFPRLRQMTVNGEEQPIKFLFGPRVDEEE